MTATKALASLSTYCIYLIDKDDSRSLLLCILEQVSDSICPHSCVKFYELAATDREKWDICLSSTRLCEHSLACSWRPCKQGSFRYFGPNFLILSRISQEVDKLADFYLSVAQPCDI